jgi:hypothetical protein
MNTMSDSFFSEFNFLFFNFKPDMMASKFIFLVILLSEARRLILKKD